MSWTSRYLAVNLSEFRVGCEYMSRSHVRNFTHIYISRAIASDVTTMEALDHTTSSTRSGNLLRSHDTSWAIISTAGVISRVHVDTGGLGTVSMVLTGEKYWAIGEPRSRVSGDLRHSTNAYADFDSGTINPHYRWEAVSLTPGTAL